MGGPNEHIPDFISNATGGRRVDALAFSRDGSYIAEHFADTGEVGMHFRLRYTSELLTRRVDSVPVPVYSMAFSGDRELLATAGDDGVVRVWSSFSGRLVGEVAQHVQNHVPVHYVGDGYSLLVSAGERELAVVDPSGLELGRVEAGSAVAGSLPYGGGARVLVLTEENRLEAHGLDGSGYHGYVPSYNVTAITGYAVSPDGRLLLMGHEDGSVYLVELEDALVPPRRRPVQRAIGGDEVVERGSQFTERIPAAEYADTEDAYHSPFEALEVEARGLFPEPRHGVEAMVGVSVLPSPHVLDLDVTAGYLNAVWLHPFYVGAQLRLSVGWPQAEFPYNYRLYGEPLAPPLMMSVELDFPVGIVVTPFGANRDVELYAEVGLGLSLHQLWNRRFGKTAIGGLLHPAFVASMAVGAGWRGLSLKVHGDYDTQLGFLLSVNVGYIFRLPYRGGGRASRASPPEGPASVEAAAPPEPVDDGGEEEPAPEAEATGLRAGGEGVIEARGESVLEE